VIGYNRSVQLQQWIHVESTQKAKWLGSSIDIVLVVMKRPAGVLSGDFAGQDTYMPAEWNATSEEDNKRALNALNVSN
jgi:hypothetical protein